MRIPRDLSGDEFAKALRILGYAVTRQVGGHMRLTTTVGGQHHVTIPAHKSLKIGTLNSILNDVAAHADLSRAEILEKLFS